MDTKLLFFIGLMILVLSTCSINPAPAESGIANQVMISPVSSTDIRNGCVSQHNQAAWAVSSSTDPSIEGFEERLVQGE